tara:strand:- start:391 stop:801 length:411 start_codon:yes stop_codon:yes gene_type:complete
MSTVYIPIEPELSLTSAERAEAIDAQIWCLRRPLSLQSPNDVTKYYFPRITHPDTNKVAIVGDTAEEIYMNPALVLDELVALLPGVPAAEMDSLIALVESNKGGTVPFEQLIPSTCVQLTEEEAKELGWLPEEPEE